jgi:hypothetical protein
MSDSNQSPSESGPNAAPALLEQLRAEGRRVSGGDFSLDAESARRKLEEFRLPDPHLYVVEIVRAAHHLGASALRVEVDANECELHIQGVEPPVADELDDLFMHAFAPQTSPRAEALRHLALGVHGAMGLDPEQIVVESRGSHGSVELRLDREGRETIEIDDSFARRRSLLRIYVDQGVRLSHLGGWVRGAASMHPEERVLRERCSWFGTKIYMEDDERPLTPRFEDHTGPLVRNTQKARFRGEDVRGEIDILLPEYVRANHELLAMSDPDEFGLVGMEAPYTLRVTPVIAGVELDRVDTGVPVCRPTHALLRDEALETDASGLRVVENRRWRRALRGLFLPVLRALEDIDLGSGLEDDAGLEGGLRLVSVDLSGSVIGVGDVRKIANSPYFAALESLDLTDNRLGISGVETLAASPHLTGLRRLTLAANDLSPRCIEVLLRSPLLDGVQYLDLGNNRLGDGGVAALVGSRRVGEVQHLDLSGNGIGSRGLRALTDSEHLENLVSLELFSNQIGPGGARVLAEAPRLAGLQHLGVSLKDIGERGAQTLAESPYLSESIRAQWR